MAGHIGIYIGRFSSGLIGEGTMDNSHLSRVLSTPNPRVFDEKVCTHVFNTLTYSVRPVTTADILCILGSGTECMTQVIYKWKPHRGDW